MSDDAIRRADAWWARQIADLGGAPQQQPVSMAALSTREALAKALYRLEWDADLYATPRNHATEKYERRADRLIASGAVVDVATLATESLVDAVAEAWYGREQPPFGPVTEWGDLSGIEQWRWRQSVCDNLSALAAALTERAS